MATGLLLLLATAPLRVAGQAPLLSGEEQALLDYINNYRIENGLNRVTVSPTLTAAALGMSQDMGENNYFSHTDSQGRSPFQRMALSGYDCEAYNTWCGENLAAGVSRGSETFELWRNSPGHNGNMLNPNYVVAGIAAVFHEDSTYGWYWTLDLGGVDDSGQAPPTATPEPTFTPPPPTSTPAPPAPTETPLEPTETALPPTQTPLEPTETALPPTESPAEPTQTAAAPTPVDTPIADAPASTAELPTQSPDRQLGQAPPTRSNTDAQPVRELKAGWNRLEVAGQAKTVAEVLPVADGGLLAIYAWDEDSGIWRRYLPGIGIPGVNTLTEMGADQIVWVLAMRPMVVTLPV